MPNAPVSKHHALSKFLATQSVVGILHISFWRKQSQCNFMWFKQINLAFAVSALLVFLHGTAQLQEVGPWPWLLTGCQPQCMNCIPHAQCDTSWTMPMITTITLACTFACTFFVAWTLACTFLWLALFSRLGLWLARFFVACTLARAFFVAWTLTSTSVGGLDFDFHFCWWLGLWLALFFVAWTLACTLACTWNYGLQLFDPL